MTGKGVIEAFRGDEQGGDRGSFFPYSRGYKGGEAPIIAVFEDRANSFNSSDSFSFLESNSTPPADTDYPGF